MRMYIMYVYGRTHTHTQNVLLSHWKNKDHFRWSVISPYLDSQYCLF